jgi:hypothetical protein
MHAVAEATMFRIVGGARAQALGVTGAAALKQRGSLTGRRRLFVAATSGGTRYPPHGPGGSPAAGTANLAPS